MATTVRQLFECANIFDFKRVNWGHSFHEPNQGIYVVSTTNDPDHHFGISETPYFDNKQIGDWIELIPSFLVKDSKATLVTIKAHLSEFWFPDESILYIGKAPFRKSGGGISNRIKEYYSTKIGKRSPHSGGQWLKTLANLETFSVYYAPCVNPSDTELKMLLCFMKNVNSNFFYLNDRKLPLPFANIKYKGNKSHKFRNQRL